MDGNRSCKMCFLSVFFFLGLIIFFIWLGMRPKSPTYTITEFAVKHGSIPFRLEFRNPNKNSQIYYDNINITCYYNQETVGSTLLPAFSQGRQETTHKSGTIRFNDKAWKTLQTHIVSNKSTEIQVALLTQVRYRTWGVKSPSHHTTLLKAQLSVASNGIIPGKTKLHNDLTNWVHES